ncbi:MAG: PKD domain-containing protein [Lewinellaceae bacterium]|nr:PKD domain-containing protein [Lewinellaceae bacterium]
MSKFTFCFTIALILCFFGKQQARAQCSFTASNNTPCATEEVTFTVNNPNPGVIYSWDLDGDGQSDLSGSSFAYNFPMLHLDSTYSITLLEDGAPCSSQDITVLAVPDPSIGVPPGIVQMIGHELKACNGSSSFELQLFNASSTYASNASYMINWGDGSPAETFDNTTFSNTSTISHVYSGLGYYTLFVTATHQNGCVFTDNYTFYNGGNPSVGLVIPGNTVGLCAPATLDFPITNTAGNPPGTEYTVYISGQEVAHFTQEELPPVFTHTFLESSCGVTTSTGNYDNAFDIKIVAYNPCNSSTATIEPIEVSEPPEPMFQITPPAFSCEGAIYGFENTTANISEVIAGNPSSCINILNPSWTISGSAGQDWNVVSGSLFGSNSIQVEFLSPGVYTIEMTLVSFACGPVTLSQAVTIYEPPAAGADITIPEPGAGPNGGCTPLTIPFNTTTNGGQLSYQWSISPTEGWAFADSTGADSPNPVVEFLGGGPYNIQLSVSNPCAQANWDTTLLLPGPPTLEIGPLPDFCQDAALSFDTTNLSIQDNGLAISDFQWDFTGSQAGQADTLYPSGIQYDTAGTYIVAFTASNSCGTATVQDTFVVQSPSTMSLPPDTTVCSSEPAFTLSATPGGGNWSGPGITANGLFNPSDANIGVNTLNYTYGVGACNTQGNMAITILAATPVIAGPDINICSNAGPVVLNGTPANGSWSSSGGGAISGNNFLPDASGPGEYTLVYAFTDANSCAVSDSLTAIVEAAPVIEAPDTSYCNTAGAMSLPTANPPGGLWSGPGVVDGNAGLFDPFVAGGAGAYLLTYAASASNGCNSTAAINIGVVDPSNVNAGPDASLCISDTPYSLNQNVVPPGGSWVGAGVSGAFFNPASAGGGVHQLLYRVGAGSCAVEDSITIDVFDPGAVEAGPGIALCQEAPPVILSGNSPANGIWSGPGITDGAFSPAGLPAATYVALYTITAGPGGCQKSDSLEIIVHPLPEPAFSLPEVLCAGNSFSPENQSQGATSFNWDFGDGASSGDPSPSHTYPQAGAYTVALEVTNAFGCSAGVTNGLEIVAPPLAAFTPSQNTGCGLLEVSLENQSSGYETNFSWDFGNGQTATQPNPGFTLSYPAGVNDTTYYIHLTAENLCGTDSHIDSLLVRPFPVVDFGFTVDTGCAPLLVEFANISVGSPESFFWDLGNGQTSTAQTPNPQLYQGDTAIINYTITLIATNSCGADTASQVLTIEPEIVRAFFNTSNTLGCAPFTVDFTNYSTQGTNVSWDFGDGNTAAIDAPTHTFESPGTYAVVLHAANACAEDTAWIAIEVLPSPEVSFAYSPNLCTGQPIQFTNTSENLAGSFWDFGDGDTSSLTNPLYYFSTPGTYSVTLTGISLQNACSTTLTQPVAIEAAPVAAFELDGDSGCTPLTVSFTSQASGGNYYQWDFGDGNSSVQPNPAHTFLQAGNYPVRLAVSTPSGCTTDTVFNSIFAFPLPEAAFAIEQEQDCGLPMMVHFQNQSEEAQGYTWDLGLAQGSALASPSQEYTEAGAYDIELLASNQYGCLDTARQTITLFDSPIADFALDTLTGCQPLRVRFANYSRGNQYYWNFGDGASSRESQATHDYVEAGWYDVTLITAYDDVCFDTLTLAGAVKVLPMPVASFEWSEELFNGNATGTINFINTSEQADYYYWDFGDGSLSEAINPTHRFEYNGSYPIQLTAIAEGGCQDDTLIDLRPELIKGLYVPNAFAPEQGSGDARHFLPKGIGLKEYLVEIFSPYGQLLWKSSLLRGGQPAEGWDGTLNGAPLPQDVYVWKIQAIFEDESLWNGSKLSGRQYQKMGSVTLIR